MTDSQAPVRMRVPRAGGRRQSGSGSWVLAAALLLLTCAGLSAAVTLPAGGSAAAPGATAPSPTGRSPKLLWTGERQAIWNRMRRENHPWWRVLKQNADRSGTPDPVYGDMGQWATLAYQMTGDPRYAQKALVMIRPFFRPGEVGSDFLREMLAEFVVMYDWLSPSLAPADRAAFIAMLNRWCVQATTNEFDPDFPIRPEDSDETTGLYFGFAFLALATAGDNPRATEFLNKRFVGGLSATGVNRATLRNAIRQYVTEMAEGGQWIEGTAYNEGTLALLMMGAEGVRTATRVDYFPEVTRYLPQAARNQIREVAPNLAATYQWGDNEWPRSMLLLRRVEIGGMLAGLTQGDPRSGPYIGQLVEELAARYGHADMDVEWRFFYFYNPYAPRADWRVALTGGQYSAGQGLLFYHDGWGPNDAFLGIHMPRRQPFVDHQVTYFGDFQLYRRGEWALTHPLGYDGPPVEALGTNTMMLGGLSSMVEFKEVVAQELGSGGEYAYLAGTNGGQYLEAGEWQPPATFLHEWTRSLLYLPSRDRRSQTLVVFDRTNAGPITDLERYREEDQARIRAAPARKQWLIHSPVRPRLSPDAIAWTTPRGQQVRVSTLWPTGQNRIVVDEDAAWPDEFPFPEKSEQKWHTRIVPATEQQWDAFLNVVQVFDAGVFLRNTRLRSREGEVQGVLAQRGGHADVLALFSVRPGPDLPQPTIHDDGVSEYNPAVPGILRGARLLRAGYTVGWTAGSTRTDLFLFDLDPGRRWVASVDGGAESAVRLSRQGLGRLTVTGARSHTLRLRAAG